MAVNSEPSCFLRTSIGRKWVVSLSGLFLIGFVVVHMAGNLQMFSPTADAINRYAHLLKSNGLLLWAFRLALLTAAAAHRKSRLHVTLASVTMVISGTVILAFVVFHLLHFTAQVVDRSYAGMETMVDGKTVHDVHRMVVAGFSKPLISGFYILAMGLLFFHLRHGAASLCQTLGFRDRHLAKLIDAGSWILAVVLFLGFSSIPVAVLLGVWKP